MENRNSLDPRNEGKFADSDRASQQQSQQGKTFDQKTSKRREEDEDNNASSSSGSRQGSTFKSGDKR